MQQTLINHTDEYLLRQRAKSNREIARTLRKYNRYFTTRDQIPLDNIAYPDALIEDLRILHSISNRILARLDDNPSGVPVMQQLELFNTTIEEESRIKKELMTNNWNKEIPCEFVTQTREEFIDEEINDIWKSIYKVHESTHGNDLSALKYEINCIVTYLNSIVEMNEYKIRKAPTIMICKFFNELIEFLSVHYEQEKEILCARLYKEQYKLERRIKEMNESTDEKWK